jgi:hypothetical protein
MSVITTANAPINSLVAPIDSQFIFVTSTIYVIGGNLIHLINGSYRTTALDQLRSFRFSIAERRLLAGSSNQYANSHKFRNGSQAEMAVFSG